MEQLPSLLKRLQDGDKTTIKSIVLLSQKKLFNFCYHLSGSTSLAEELAQEVYLKFFTKTPPIVVESEFYSWLFTVTRHTFVDKTRTAEFKVESKAASEVEMDEVPSSDIDNQLTVIQVLQKLSTADRELLILVDQEGYSGDEAAKLLGIKPDALRARIVRARKKFILEYQSQTQERTR